MYVFLEHSDLMYREKDLTYPFLMRRHPGSRQLAFEKTGYWTSCSASQCQTISIVYLTFLVVTPHTYLLVNKVILSFLPLGLSFQRVEVTQLILKWTSWFNDNILFKYVFVTLRVCFFLTKVRYLSLMKTLCKTMAK